MRRITNSLLLALLLGVTPALANEDSSDHFDCGHVGSLCKDQGNDTANVPEPNTAILIAAGIGMAWVILRFSRIGKN